MFTETEINCIYSSLRDRLEILNYRLRIWNDDPEYLEAIADTKNELIAMKEIRKKIGRDF